MIRQVTFGFLISMMRSYTTGERSVRSAVCTLLLCSWCAHCFVWVVEHWQLGVWSQNWGKC